MKRIFRGWIALALLAWATGANPASTPFTLTTESTQDYDLYPGDFNGDGFTDLLYIAKNPNNSSGIILSDGTNLSISFQSWSSNYLGISWSSNSYNVIVADFNGDGKADILLQSKIPGDSYLLLTGSTGITAISQTIPVDTAGVLWSADQHAIVAGDFNGDGKADVFLQATTPAGLNAVITADANGQFTASEPTQSWNDGYLGFNWAATEANIFAGDFNGDGRADLLIQAQPTAGTGPSTPQPTQFLPNMNGVVLAQSGTPIFAAAGVQAWSENGFSADWSPLDSGVVVGDFNGDGRMDTILQGLTSTNPTYLLYGNSPGPIFSTATGLSSDLSPSADYFRLIPGHFSNSTGDGLFMQSQIRGQSNYLGRISGGSITGGIPPQTVVPSGPSSGTNDASTTSTPAVAGAIVTPSAAGRTPGVFSVSPTGSANYHIPLQAPPGVGAVQLNLALNYDSRGSNGIMGMGWSVGGLSAITRCNKTVAQDGAAGPVTLQLSSTYSDRFCLDGKQLKLTGGSYYGAASSTYATEIESFSLIQASSTMAGNGPASFTVTTKNGLIYTYGGVSDPSTNPTNSQVYAGTSGTIRTWALSEIADREGNRIFLYYQQSNGTYRLDHIYYPWTASGQGPFYIMRFTYGARPTNDIPSSYIDGYLVTEPNQLNSITTYAYPAGTVIKVYNLAYTQSATTNRNTLTGLQECSASTCLTATTIGYQTGGTGWSTTGLTAGSTIGSLTGPWFGDFNGDGRTDILYGVCSGACTSGMELYVILASGSGYAAAIDTGIQMPWSRSISTYQWQPMIGRVLGKGQDQILVAKSGYWYVLDLNGSTFSQTKSNAVVNGEFALADVDGDGLADLVSWPATAILVRRNTTSAGGAPTFSGAAQSVYNANASWTNFLAPEVTTKVADFNGDGRADLLVFVSGTGWLPLFSNGANSSGVVQPFTAGTSFGGVGAGPPGAVQLMDWNGDGCSDVFFYTAIYVSNCAGGFQYYALQPGQGVNNFGQAGPLPPVVIDWDGDGRDDLLYYNAGDNFWHVLLSNGGNPNTATDTSLGIIPQGPMEYFTLDQTGDGRRDLAWANSIYFEFGSITWYPHNGTGIAPDLAISFSDGFAMKQSPTYVPLTNSTYYDEYTTASFPEEDYKAPLYVVNQFTASDGTGTTYQDQLYYYGARTQVQGRGFEGFYAKRAYDSRNSLYTYDYYEQTFPYTGMEFNHTVASATEHIQAWSAVPSVQTLTGLGGYQTRWFPYFGSDTTTLWETGGPKDGQQISQSTKTTTYGDGYGNPTQIVISTTDTDSTAPASPFNGLTWTQTLNATYFNDTTHNCLGLPDTLSDQRAVPGQTTQTRNFSYLADTTNCRTTQKTIEPGVSGLQVTIAYGFDDTCSSNGNSVAVTGENPDGTAMPTRTTYYKYTNTTSRCQLPELITNALGQSTAIAYNYNFGVEASLTDPNGLITSLYQDDYGRNNEVVRPDNTYSLTSYYSCSTPPCWGVTDLRFYVVNVEYGSDGNSITESHAFYDGFNRPRDEESYRSNGLGNATVWNIDALHTYDSLGRKIQLTLPYSTSLNGYVQWSSYDALNRPLTQKLYQGNGTLDRTTTYSYLGRTFQTTDPRSNTVSRVTDVLSNLREVIDPSPGGTTTYAFDAFGNLDQTVDAVGATSGATFNLRGFRTQMVDPDMGTWNYTGDSLNELVSWKDAKTQPFSAGYDLLGRMTSRTEPEGTSTWTWGSTASLHNIGQLQEVTGYGYTENLGYDSVARLYSRSIVSDQTYTYYYGYNAQGLLSTVTYPTSPVPTGTMGANFEIEYSYSVGEPVEIQDVTNSTPITLWTSVSNNDSRLPTQVTIGASPAAVTVTTGYKAWTNQILSLQAGTGGSTTNLQNLGYAWDTTDNLTQRGDANQPGTCTVNGSGSKLCEVFTPDALNRLSSSTLNGTTNLTVQYTAAGDIVTRSDVGTYNYGDNVPFHGVTQAGSNTYTYDANGNANTKNGLAQTWASYNLPTTLQGSPSGTTYTSQFSYGPEHERYKEVSTYSDGTETTEFVGDTLEKMTASSTGKTYWRQYVSTPSGEQIIVSRNSDYSTSKTFVFTDHLGSSDTVVNGLTGALLLKESSSPFGQRRQSNWTPGVPSTWYQTALTEGTRRGFGFHEQLDGVGLIHMNGRVYDPAVGRFLSVDPIAGDGGESQRLNPYAYVSNRPLNLTDPSGLDERNPQIPIPLPPPTTTGTSGARDFSKLGPVSQPPDSSGAETAKNTGEQSIAKPAPSGSNGQQPGGGTPPGGGGGVPAPPSPPLTPISSGLPPGVQINAHNGVYLPGPFASANFNLGPYASLTVNGSVNAVNSLGNMALNAADVPLSFVNEHQGEIISAESAFAGGGLAAAGTLALARVSEEIEAASAANAAIGGRLGNAATRAHVDEVATAMENRGWTIKNGGGRGAEEYLPGPGGARRGSSYPDITATKNGKTLRVNTVDTRADGVTPTTREARNAARIRRQTGEHVLTTPKP